jgi:ankyrin repeat protein
MASMLIDFNADPNASIWPSPSAIQVPLHFLAHLWIKRRDKFALDDPFEPHLIKLLLNKGASANCAGFPPMMRCSTALQEIAKDLRNRNYRETLEIAQMLLEAGADVNSRGYHSGLVFDETPLQIASSLGRVEMVKLLLEYNADVNAATMASGETALQGVIQFLTQPLWGLSQTVQRQRGWAILNALLEKGANINSLPHDRRPGSSRMTTLQWAVYAGDLDLTQHLLDLHADVNAPAGGKGSAIQVAARNGDLVMAHLLIDHGANVNAYNTTLIDNTKTVVKTALECAAGHGRLDMVQLLINAGADTHLPGGERYRAAENIARNRGHFALADLLKDNFDDGAWD